MRMTIQNAWILNVGTEVVMGVVVNTNGSWLARKLTSIGYRVDRIIVVPDSKKDVVEEVRRALSRGVRVLIVTGGLGPTYDDNTSSFIAEAINRRMILNAEAYKMVSEKYKAMEQEMTPPREKQAWMPEGSIPIPNPVGTAPGFVIEVDGTIIVCLPGVPREMKRMFEDYVEKRLRELSEMRVVDEWFVIEGVEESSIASIIEAKAKEHPEVYVKTHPTVLENGGFRIRVQVTAAGRSEEEAKQKALEVALDIRKALEEAGVRCRTGQ